VETTEGLSGEDPNIGVSKSDAADEWRKD
jgi:hypothetical protein